MSGFLFVAEPEAEHEVRRRIELSLSGHWRFPEGFSTPWQLHESEPSEVTPEETVLAERLARS